VARVLVIGSANVDLAVTVERLPAPGETVSEGTLLVNHGGKGANQAVAARRLGADVRFIGCVGQDAGGQDVVSGLQAEGIGVDGVTTSPAAATGTALIVVDARGANQIAVAPGANRQLAPADVERRRQDFEWADVVVCQLEIPLESAIRALEVARRHAKTTILDPAPVRPLESRMWTLVDYLTPNAGEAGRLSGFPAVGPSGAADAARALRAGGVGTVVVTLGEHGALACTSDRNLQVPAFPITAVDTTAAGDAWTGALAVALAEGTPLPDSLRFANAAGALACTKAGAQPSLPSRGEVERLLTARPRPKGAP
jgi:ribokinase